jgi:NarL family two-component system response regulator LiaR
MNASQTPQTIRVMLVDDHNVVRSGLATFLRAYEDLELVGEAKNGLEALDLCHRKKPDVVLMDLLMPEMDGIEATRKIRALSPRTQVIVLTSFAEDEKVFPSIKAGALGYLLKDVSPGELVKAIQAAHRGEAQLHPEIARKLMDEFSTRAKEPIPGDLTERELEVLRLIARGRSNRQIAEELVISEKTVKTHVSNILSKLHLADRTQAAIYALREGLVPEE